MALLRWDRNNVVNNLLSRNIFVLLILYSCWLFSEQKIYRIFIKYECPVS